MNPRRRINSAVRRLSLFGREHGNRIQPTHRFYNSTGTAVIMRGKKILVIIIALALLLACIVALRLRRPKPVGPSVSETSRLIGGPAFEVQVEMPAFNSGRAPWEILASSWVTIVDRGSIRQVLAPRSAR